MQFIRFDEDVLFLCVAGKTFILAVKRRGLVMIYDEPNCRVEVDFLIKNFDERGVVLLCPCGDFRNEKTGDGAVLVADMTALAQRKLILRGASQKRKAVGLFHRRDVDGAFRGHVEALHYNRVAFFLLRRQSAVGEFRNG